jgi:thiosulfate/3-mercaptopyruvate sulfurtransferase
MITVNSQWLSAHLDDPDVIIIDSRGNFPYKLGHVKNSRVLGVDRVISVSNNGANLVIDASTAEKMFSELGIDYSKTVVVYGEYMDPSAARIVWTLMYYGHSNTKLLDIDFSTFQRMWPLSVTTEIPNPASTNVDRFKPRANPTIRVDAEGVKARLDDPQVIIIDARTPQEHIQARIPGSRLHSWEDGLGADGQMMKSKEKLEEDFKASGIDKNKEIICYCHSGARSSHKFLQFKQAGFENVRMYDGSIIDWAQRRYPLR